MNYGMAIAAGAAGTAAMTMIMYAANMMGMVKMDMSLMLGSLLGAERNSARVAGMVVHFMVGMWFGLIYAAIWYGLGISPTWYWGLLFGFIHGVIASAMLTMMSLMPATSQLATASGGGHGGSSSGSASLSGETRVANAGGAIMLHLVFGLIVAVVYVA